MVLDGIYRLDFVGMFVSSEKMKENVPVNFVISA
jgi:hypothetical protein